MKKFLIALGTFALPALAFAQTTLFSIATTIKVLVSYILPILFAIAILFLLFNLIRYVLAGDAEKKEDAKSYMIMSFIALAFFALVFGLIAVLGNTFGINRGTDVQTSGTNDFIPTVYY